MNASQCLGPSPRNPLGPAVMDRDSKAGYMTASRPVSTQPILLARRGSSIHDGCKGMPRHLQLGSSSLISYRATGHSCPPCPPHPAAAPFLVVALREAFCSWAVPSGRGSPIGNRPLPTRLPLQRRVHFRHPGTICLSGGEEGRSAALSRRSSGTASASGSRVTETNRKDP